MMEGKYEYRLTTNKELWIDVTITLRGTNHGVTMYYLDFGEGLSSFNCSKEDKFLMEKISEGTLVERKLIEPMKHMGNHRLNIK